MDIENEIQENGIFLLEMKSWTFLGGGGGQKKNFYPIISWIYDELSIAYIIPIKIFPRMS